MESLHAEKKLDHFEHESPIRAFTDWTVTGLYAIGKGFRPSLSHMTVYMDAMEAKEGWRLLQILESDTQRPSFVFRCERRLSDEELLARHALTPEDEQRLRDLLDQAPPLSPIMPEIAEKAGFEPARSPLADHKWYCYLVTDGGACSCRPPHHMSIGEWVEHGIPITGGPSDLAERAEAMRPKPFVYDPKMMFRGTMANGLIDLEKEKLARSLFANPAETIDRVEFGTGRVLESVPLSKAKGDDPINPKHYSATENSTGRECADIGERLSANGYQILKYCWRLGKKDNPCQELGKAVWYGESEDAYISLFPEGSHVYPNLTGLKRPDAWFARRIEEQPPFTQNIARMLWEGYDQRRLQAILETINEHRFHLECGRGLAI